MCQLMLLLRFCLDNEIPKEQRFGELSREDVLDKL